MKIQNKLQIRLEINKKRKINGKNYILKKN